MRARKLRRARAAALVAGEEVADAGDASDAGNDGKSISLVTEGDTRPISGEAPDATLEELAEYFQDDEDGECGELDAVIDSIGHEINCLLRLSVTIRNPAPHDQLKSRAGAETVAYFRDWATQYITAKFPKAEGYVQQRLVGAVSRRRQYLKYREERTAHLADGLNEDTAPTVADPVEPAITITSLLPDHLKRHHSPKEPVICDNIPEASGTSYTTSVSSTHRLRLTLLPEEPEDGSIKCPFCHMFILVRKRSDWK
ncbi:hypothetical protein NLG97_g294 [Lecanicillium saksenae]|uniref:Uncharacterized protein n=1 Tax=Lecanicillium saksenae TaxID=468837 RepID=A0ACC1R872_9HYPO|nr:hypothetical protein NLG97_g294 [Lecanicillium saksenae]